MRMYYDYCRGVSTNDFVTGVLYLSPSKFSIVNLTLPAVRSSGSRTISASFEYNEKSFGESVNFSSPCSSVMRTNFGL